MGSGQFGLSSSSTADEVLGDKNLEGKHYFVTGANTGIGLETTRVLFNHGATVTMACRNKTKMEKAKESLSEQAPKDCKGKLHTVILDLSDLDSVRNCVKQMENRQELHIFQGIDVLINNAGLMTNTTERTKEGIHLIMGTHAITMGLLPLINLNGRIVVVASEAHIDMGPPDTLDIENLHFKEVKKEFPGIKLTVFIYGVSKLCNILFARDLNRRLKESGKGITCYSLHPGLVDSDFIRYASEDHPYLMKLFMTLLYFKRKSLPQGAATQVFCACDDRVLKYAGQYFADCDLCERMTKAAKDDDLAKRLFEKTEKMIDVKYPFKKVGDEETEEIEED